jgi:nicotinate-nucleotide pyrophosphorylase (carboxylating)
LDQALEAGADLVLLDNFEAGNIAEAVTRAAGRARVEVSGGVRLADVPSLARAGVDYISVGALTHSAPAADIALEVETLGS